jgi:hypothetical protein
MSMGRVWVLALLVSIAVAFPADNDIEEGENYAVMTPQDAFMEGMRIDTRGDDSFLSGVLHWKKAQSEVHLAGYDVMFAMTRDPASRMAFVDHILGQWIVQKNPHGNYFLEITNERIPYGAKYLMIFPGFPADESIPGIISLYDEPEPPQANIQEKSEKGFAFEGITLPEPVIPPSLASQALAETVAVDTPATDNAVTQKPTADKPVSKMGAGSALQPEMPPAAAPKTSTSEAKKAGEHLEEGSLVQTGDEPEATIGERDWQVQKLSVRLSVNQEQHLIRGVIGFEAANNQPNGIYHYHVWWGSECNNDKKVNDTKSEDGSGVLMTFYRDVNMQVPYERYFDWRRFPRAANFLLIISTDQYDIPLASPMCYGPLNISLPMKATVADAKDPALIAEGPSGGAGTTQPDGLMELPPGTETISRANAMARAAMSAASAASSSAASSAMASQMLLSDEPSSEVRTMDNSKPIHFGETLLETTVDANAESTFMSVGYIGAVWDHLPYLGADRYQIPWAMRSFSPSPSPVTFPTISPSPSNEPSPSPSGMPLPPIENPCNETNRSPRDVQFTTSGPSQGRISGVLSWRPAQDDIGAVAYRVFFSQYCSLDSILTNSEHIEEQEVNPALPHKSYDVSLASVQLRPGARYLLVIGVNEEHLFIGDAFCMSIRGGHCPNSNVHSGPRCPAPSNSMYTVRQAGFSTAGPIDGKLSGVLTFRDAAYDLEDPRYSVITKYYARLSKTCDAQGIIRSHGHDYHVFEWLRRPETPTAYYTGLLKDVELPTNAKYILLFSSDDDLTPLGPPVAVQVFGQSNDTRTSMLVQEGGDNIGTVGSARLRSFSLNNLKHVTEEARDQTAKRVIGALPNLIEMNTFMGLTEFEIMEVSADDVDLSNHTGHHTATLFGVPDLVTQHIRNTTKLTPFIHRSQLQEPAVEKPDFAYSLLVSTLPVQFGRNDSVIPIEAPAMPQRVAAPVSEEDGKAVEGSQSLLGSLLGPLAHMFGI